MSVKRGCGDATSFHTCLPTDKTSPVASAAGRLAKGSDYRIQNSTAKESGRGSMHLPQGLMQSWTNRAKSDDISN
jgi:hypothetical protein